MSQEPHESGEVNHDKIVGTVLVGCLILAMMEQPRSKPCGLDVRREEVVKGRGLNVYLYLSVPNMKLLLSIPEAC